MEWIQQLLDSSTTPLLTAFLLGLLTAISPCPLATNITAIGFISRDLESRNRIFWNGVLYTLGRVLSYTILGIVLIGILREGSSLFKVQKIVSKWGEMVLSPALILIGLFMLFGDKLKLPSFGFNGSGGDGLKSRGGLGALLLGVLFALAFCPTSGVFYFGMLIPMSATSAAGYLMPVVFAVATALPVIIVAWVLAYSVGEIGKVYNRIKLFQKWFSLVVALLFIAVGIYYGIMFYL
ncbi:MAG: aromatic aminobenezylarsenical efflux permease ArsG family transporter [Rikenellaceae bacterium]